MYLLHARLLGSVSGRCLLHKILNLEFKFSHSVITGSLGLIELCSQLLNLLFGSSARGHVLAELAFELLGPFDIGFHLLILVCSLLLQVRQLLLCLFNFVLQSFDGLGLVYNLRDVVFGLHLGVLSGLDHQAELVLVRGVGEFGLGQDLLLLFELEAGLDLSMEVEEGL